MKLRTALLGATVLSVPFAIPMAAKAQPINGIYIGAGVGVNYRFDQDVSSVNVGTSTTHFYDNSERFRSQIGVLGLGSVGYGFGNGLRVELEGGYRDNKLNKLVGGANTNNVTKATLGGNAQTVTAMANVAYDVDLGPASFVYPYVGVGAGYAWTRFHNARTTNLPAYGDYITDNFEGNFAYQAFVGAAFPISSIPGLSLTAEARFLGTLDNNSYSVREFTSASTSPVSATWKMGGNYNVSGLVGFRYAFGVAPAPVAVQPPAVQPTRSYLVFFDWDKSLLTVRARQIIAEAAANSTKVSYTRIEVNGYTDTSGTPTYNQGLSIRRAQSVATELVRDGVPRGAISIAGYGEDPAHLLVQTGPGVREPQNRRVEIIIR